MIYLDTSGAIKLVRPEEHSGELSGWFERRQESPVVSSVLIEVEIMRAARCSAPDRLGRAAEVLRGIGVVALSSSVVARASAYADPDLRSLDAIHVATAEHVAAVTGTNGVRRLRRAPARSSAQGRTAGHRAGDARPPMS